MKIGEVEVRKIPAGKSVPCENGCPEPAVAYYNCTPFCVECLREEQQTKWDQDGNFFINVADERVYYEVVEQWTTHRVD